MTDDVLSGVNVRGRQILVTGVSAGLGVETARSLAAHGAHVVGAGRDLTKAAAATEKVPKDSAAHGGSSSWLSWIWQVSKVCLPAPINCWRKQNRSMWSSPMRV
jgi:NAD(P)-dependent dehydrogenase (short-subunit alcohol dehydrogenase family)